MEFYVSTRCNFFSVRNFYESCSSDGFGRRAKTFAFPPRELDSICVGGRKLKFKSTYSQFALVEAHPKRFVSEKQSEVRNLSKFVNFLPMIFNHDRVLLFFHFAGMKMEVPMDRR